MKRSAKIKFIGVKIMKFYFLITPGNLFWDLKIGNMQQQDLLLLKNTGKTITEEHDLEKFCFVKFPQTYNCDYLNFLLCNL